MKKKALLIGGIAAAVVLAGGWALAQSRQARFRPGGFGPGGFRAADARREMGPGMSGMQGPMGQGMSAAHGSGAMRQPGMMGELAAWAPE